MNKLRIIKYNENPTICLNCGKHLLYKSRNNKFCSQSCAGTYNNSFRKKQRYCLNCGKELNSSQDVFCSNNCQKESYYKQYIER